MVSDLLPGRTLQFTAVDIGTNSAEGRARRKSSLAAYAIRSMTDMRDNGTVAFIGPDDTCFSEALVAAAWNLPMISYVSIFSHSFFKPTGFIHGIICYVLQCFRGIYVFLYRERRFRLDLKIDKN